MQIVIDSPTISRGFKAIDEAESWMLNEEGMWGYSRAKTSFPFPRNRNNLVFPVGFFSSKERTEQTTEVWSLRCFLEYSVPRIKPKEEGGIIFPQTTLQKHRHRIEVDIFRIWNGSSHNYWSTILHLKWGNVRFWTATDYAMDVLSSSSGNSYASVAIMSGTVFIVFSTICWIFMSSAETSSSPRRRMSGMYSALTKVAYLATGILNNLLDVVSFADTRRPVFSEHFSRMMIFRTPMRNRRWLN